MTRTPLRPLARILEARASGQNPDVIEKENIRARHEVMRDGSRRMAEGRLLLLGVAFAAAFGAVGLRMGALASSEPMEPRSSTSTASILSNRADIVDRDGRILATNIATHSLYAQPPYMIDKNHVARELATIFPELSEEKLKKDFSGKRKFLWIRKKISPEQMQMVHDIGDPGLQFGPREMRLYPNGKLASHVLGGAGFGREDVQSAEIVGAAGIEKTFDAYLRDPANDGAPLALSLDLPVQAAVERVLAGGMSMMRARAAGAVVMNAKTGEVVSLVSLPDFDPNKPPHGLWKGEASDNPLFNRMVQGVYELGSTFKIFTVAQALEERLVNPSTMIETKGPLRWGKYRIRDFHNYGPELSVRDVIVNSSNIGTARMAIEIGAERQQDFLGKLGLLDPAKFELAETASGKPIKPKKWSELSTMTVSYGHGLSVSPLQLAAAYATVTGGGRKVTPTLLRQSIPPEGEQVISAATSQELRKMLRAVVTEGTASLAEVPGYRVGGKTGTADKPDRVNGGYHDDRVIATFAGVFPADKPQFVIVVMLDEPVETSGTEPRRTAGWTAVPVAAEIVNRIAPLMGVRPLVEGGDPFALSLNSN